MESEKTTDLRTPTASDPVLSEVVRRAVEAYRWRWLSCFGLAGFGHGEASFDFAPTMEGRRISYAELMSRVETALRDKWAHGAGLGRTTRFENKIRSRSGAVEMIWGEKLQLVMHTPAPSEQQ